MADFGHSRAHLRKMILLLQGGGQLGLHLVQSDLSIPQLMQARAWRYDAAGIFGCIRIGAHLPDHAVHRCHKEIPHREK